MTSYPVNNVILNWHCHECNRSIQQPLFDITDIGIPICNCDHDMVLMSNVTLVDLDVKKGS